MAIKVFIKRYVKKGKTKDTLALLNEVRSQALKQPGYISGETLVNHYDPSNITIVSTLQTIDDWIRWQESDERAVQEDQLEKPPITAASLFTTVFSGKGGGFFSLSCWIFFRRFFSLFTITSGRGRGGFFTFGSGFSQ